MSRIDCITALQLGANLLKKAGFTLHHVSRRSDSCYYEHPARQGMMLRLSTHKYRGAPIGRECVVACCSFTPADELQLLTQTIVNNRITWAIGRYFLADEKVSKYSIEHSLERKALSAN